jgi:hypothetical protein
MSPSDHRSARETVSDFEEDEDCNLHKKESYYEYEATSNNRAAAIISCDV